MVIPPDCSFYKFPSPESTSCFNPVSLTAHIYIHSFTALLLCTFIFFTLNFINSASELDSNKNLKQTQ